MLQNGAMAVIQRFLEARRHVQINLRMLFDITNIQTEVKPIYLLDGEAFSGSDVDLRPVLPARSSGLFRSQRGIPWNEQESKFI
jgi:hypothetical protein